MDDEDDFLPKSGAELDAFLKKLLAAVSPDPASYGLTPEDVAALRASHAAWVKSWNAEIEAYEALRVSTEHMNALEAARAAFTTAGGKDGALGVPVSWAMLLTSVRANPSVAHPRHRTSGPKTRPVARTETDGPLRLLLRFADQESPERPGVPDGVSFCEIRTYVGERAPAAPESYAFLVQLTRPPYLDAHEPEDAGKRVFYILRWQDADLTPGPWSTVLTAIVPG